MLSDIVVANYGRPLKEEDREQSGAFDVFGSSGPVGKHTTRLVDEPTLIIGRKGSVGSITYAPNGGWPIDTTFFLEWQRHIQGDWKYLFYALQAANLDKHTITTSIPGLNRDRLLETGIFFPELNEQRRIATVLDKADAIRKKRQESLKLADEFLRSVFLDMFGDPIRNPKEWIQCSLDNVKRPGTSITYGIVQAGPHVENGVPYIRTSDFKNGELQTVGLGKTAFEIAARFQRSRVDAGDLVYCIRASIGAVDIVQAELNGANLTQGTARIACSSDIINEFLKWQLRTPQFKTWIDSHSKGATFKEITLETLRSAPVIIPPLGLQKRFTSIARSLDRLIKNQRIQLQAASEYVSSLSHYAFNDYL